MKRYLDLSNEAPAYTMWELLEPQVESVRQGLARAFGCDPEEMAITRNASEGLEIVQLGLDLKAGDEVLTTTQDYPRMLTTWRQRERRDGIVMKTFPFPTPPPSLDDLAERFERAITPRTRVILVCLKEGSVIGYIGGHLSQRYDCDGELQYLYVVPEHRREGIASELLALLASWFAEEEAARICVDVEPDNAPARAFYARHGAVDLSEYWMVWTDIAAVLG